MELADHIAAILILLLAGIYPIADAKRFKVKLDRITNTVNGERISIYWELLFLLWGMFAVVIGLWVYQGYPFEELGFRYENTWRFWLITGLVLIISIVMLSNYFRLKNDPKARKDTLETLNKNQAIQLIPRNSRELKYWSLCSVSASSEEIVYRGFLLWYLMALTNIIVASIISCLLFAFAHTYQGKTGIIQTGVYGIVLLAMYLISNSLWPPVIFHVAQDFSVGLAGYVCFTMPTEANHSTQEVTESG